MAVAELFLGAFLQVLFERLSSAELLHFASSEGIHSKLKKLETVLFKINALLDDAEEKQVAKRSVQLWLGELRDVAHDVEDILDEFATEALRRSLATQSKANDSTGSKVWNLLPTCFSSFAPSSLEFNLKMRSKIKEVTARLKVIAAQKGDLGLTENAGWGPIRVRRRLPTTCLIKEADVVGREGDKEMMLKLLFGGGIVENEVSVIPIVGMGGVGKTTLAQLVYNDPRVSSYYDLKAWACVTEVFDVVRVTRTILSSVASGTFENNDLNSLQVKLKEKLFKKKFLLVLDDVWHENYDEWTKFCIPFEGGALESKIILTTRNLGVSSIMGTASAYRLGTLSNEDCLAVFAQHALGERDFCAHPELKETGEEIIKRCDGLPLAAKTLAGLLRSKLNPNDWDNVLRDNIWDIPEEQSGVIPALRLSYYHLPSPLKRCFAYCSVIPKDYEFKERELVLLWMAEGLIQDQENKQIEDIGSEYFNDLLSRSLIQHSSRRKSRFFMHDLINDLAQWVAGDICFRLEDKLDNTKLSKISKRVRYMSYIRGEFDGIKRFEAFDKFECLRSFLSMGERRLSWLTNYVPKKMLPKFTILRSLSLCGYDIVSLPDSIGHLKHLRYLNLSNTSIVSLPESISTLYNLQTLLLKECSCLKEMCVSIGNLKNLRHLNNSRTNLLERMPLQVGKLSSLQKLTAFVVSKANGSRLRELGPLSYLRGKLHILRLQHVTEADDARDANLSVKEGLKVLLLEWSGKFDDSRNELTETEVLDMLQPPRKLQKLIIRGFGGVRFPTWLSDQPFSNMVFLTLENCNKCKSLPSLGQIHSLKHLHIEGMNGVRRVAHEFYGEGYSKAFPSLESLCFVDMQEWEEWSRLGLDQNSEEFPCLSELSIKNCPKLFGTLQNSFLSLKKFVICNCKQLVVSIPSLQLLSQLEIEGCKELKFQSETDDNSLNSLAISGISGFTGLPKEFMSGLKKLERLEIMSCPELISLVADEEAEEKYQWLPRKLERLELWYCERFEKLPEWLHCLTSLQELIIVGCSRLSFPKGGLSMQSTLRTFTVLDCKALDSLPNFMVSNSHNASLECLTIESCDSLQSIGKGQLPRRLKKLCIKYCQNLQCLLEEDSSSNSSSSRTPLLESLQIICCSSLTHLSSSGELPATLKYLNVISCENLESIAYEFHSNTSLEEIVIGQCENLKSLPQGLHKLSHLKSFNISGCPSLFSFHEGGLPVANLTKIRISNCARLVALLGHQQVLFSLQTLEIDGSPNITVSVEMGFPTNITSLSIDNLNMWKAVFEQGLLHRLTSLKELTLKGEFFPDEDRIVLPTSLTKLTMQDFTNLQYLPFNGFRNLTYLESLEIYGCPKLKAFPQHGLPISLSRLKIRWCPLLQQRCKKDQGQYWPTIAYLPCVDLW